jgi:acyl carrier protein
MTPSPEPPLDQRIRAAIIRALNLGLADPPVPLALGSTPGWDSMGHMTVVMELEREFGTLFPVYRLPELIDVASIARALANQSQPSADGHR